MWWKTQSGDLLNLDRCDRVQRLLAARNAEGRDADRWWIVACQYEDDEGIILAHDPDPNVPLTEAAANAFLNRVGARLNALPTARP